MNIAARTTSHAARNAVSASVLAALAVSASLLARPEVEEIVVELEVHEPTRGESTIGKIVTVGTSEHERVVEDLTMSSLAKCDSSGVVYARIEGGRATTIDVQGDARAQHCMTFVLETMTFRVVEPFDVMIPVD